MQTVSRDLDQMELVLAREFAEAAETKRWFLAGKSVDDLRTRVDGDSTHRFDEVVEERCLHFFERTRLLSRFSSTEHPDTDLVGSPELLALLGVASKGLPDVSAGENSGSHRNASGMEPRDLTRTPRSSLARV